MIKAFDPNNDGTLDLKEVQEPAGAKLDVLDCDKDGTPNAKELKGLLAGKMLRETDLNNDGTLDKKEHLALVKALFRKANPAK